MSHFYGTLQGNRGEATRCGTKSSGVETYAAGWGGAIRTVVYLGDDGKDKFAVYLTPWQYSGGKSQLIAGGDLDAFAEAEYLTGKSGGGDMHCVILNSPESEAA